MSREVVALQLFDDSQCASLCRRIDDLRRDWIERDPRHGFWTLGPASYIDLAKLASSVDYWTAAARHRQMVQAVFLKEYRAISEAIASAMDEKVSLAEPLAYPGFHIRDAAALPREPRLNGHFDIQYAHVPWKRLFSTVTPRVFSFTMALEMPTSGAGLITYDMHLVETFTGLSRDEIQARGFSRPSNRTKYDKGVLYLHTGLYFHEVDWYRSVLPVDRRITVQGHGRFCDGAWQLYW